MSHVFISYVHSDRDLVDRLAKELTNSGVTVWLDRNDIQPGTRWRDAIRTAIQSGNYFIACFSREYEERERTHMSEEITIAIDELRVRPHNRIWFIPVLLTESKIPSRPISSVEDLSDIQAVKLYEDWDRGITQILRTLMYNDPIMSRIWYLIDIGERPFDNERLYAISQLSEMRATARPALSFLAKATKDNNLEIKTASLKALGVIGPPAAEAVPALTAALNDPDKSVRSNAAVALRRIGRAAVSTLVAALNDPDKSNRSNACIGLRTIGPPAAEAVPALAAALNDPDAIVRSNATEALGMMRRSAAEAVPVLAAALNDPYTFVRSNAAVALGMIGPPAAEAVPALAAALNDTDAIVRSNAPDALRRIGRAAVPALAAAFNNPDAVVRGGAAVALGTMRPSAAEAIAALAAALDDPDAIVRSNAAVALGTIGSSRHYYFGAPEKIQVAAVPALAAALNDPDAIVRGHAAMALEMIRSGRQGYTMVG